MPSTFVPGQSGGHVISWGNPPSEPSTQIGSPQDVFEAAWDVIRAALDAAAPSDYPSSEQVHIARWVIEHPPLREWKFDKSE